MPEYLSVVEASRRYSISEKTLRNWIKDGLLPATKVRLAGRLHWAILPAQLEEVMIDRNIPVIPERTGTVLADLRIEDLEQRLLALEYRLDRLEQSHSIDVSPIQQQPFLPEFQTQARSTPPAKRSAPAGQLSFYQFADLHRVGRSGNIARWRADHPEYFQDQATHDTSGHTIEAILTAEGEHAFYEWMKNRKTKNGRNPFTPCDNCPH